MTRTFHLKHLVMELQSDQEAWAFLIVFLLAAWVPSFILYRDLYFHRRIGRAVVLWLISAVWGIGYICEAMSALSGQLNTDQPHINFTTIRDRVFVIACGGLAVMFVIPFLAKLYGKWFEGRATEAESMPGKEGLRTWLTGPHIVWCLLIAGFVTLGSNGDINFFLVLAVAILLLIAYPIYQTLTLRKPAAIEDAGTVPDTGLVEERDRVLRMLEDGKINAQESAELLHALSETEQPTATRMTTLKLSQKIMLAGGILLLIGFFMPWVSIDLDKEVARMRKNISIPELGQIPTERVGPRPTLPKLSDIQMKKIRFSGGEINNGWGWWILLLGLSVIALPWMAPTLESNLSRRLTFILLVLGTFLILFVLSNHARYASVGILITLAAYGTLWFGVLKEYRKHGAAEPQPK